MMKKVFIGLFALATALAFAYSGCGGDSGTKDGGVDASTGDTGVADGGGTSDAGKTCTVSTDSIVGKPCTTANAATECAGITSPSCLTEEFCASLICGPGEDCSKCNIPNGYCSSLEFMLNPPGSCGKGAMWFNVSEIDPTISAALCVKCCNVDADCRVGEEYWCYKDSTGRGGCVPPGFHVILDKDGGT